MKKPLLTNNGGKCIQCGSKLKPRWETWYASSGHPPRNEPRPVVGEKNYRGDTIIAVMPEQGDSLGRTVLYATNRKLGAYDDGYFCTGTCARHYAVIAATNAGRRPARQGLRDTPTKERS